MGLIGQPHAAEAAPPGVVREKPDVLLEAVHGPATESHHRERHTGGLRGGGLRAIVASAPVAGVVQQVQARLPNQVHVGIRRGWRQRGERGVDDLVAPRSHCEGARRLSLLVAARLLRLAGPHGEQANDNCDPEYSHEDSIPSLVPRFLA